MASILDRARNQFRARMGSELRVIEVPEWPDEDGHPTKIFFRPVLNFLEQEEITQLVDQGKKMEAIVRTLILRARDSEGKALFRKDQRVELMRQCDPEVIARIVTEMSEASTIDLEEIEKN